MVAAVGKKQPTAKPNTKKAITVKIGTLAK